MTNTTVYLTVDWEKGTIKQKLAQLPKIFDEKALEAINAGADFIVVMAKTLVHVDTGTLQKSIRKERTRNRVVSVRAGGYFTNPKTGTICNYAQWVENNYPYMQPSVDMARNYVTELIKSRIVGAIKSEQ